MYKLPRIWSLWEHFHAGLWVPLMSPWPTLAEGSVPCLISFLTHGAARGVFWGWVGGFGHLGFFLPRFLLHLTLYKLLTMLL